MVDGDFCSLFDSLPEGEKARLAHSLGKDVQETSNLIYQFNSRFK